MTGDGQALIRSERPVRRLFVRQTASPGSALVYIGADGRIVDPGAGTLLWSGARLVFEVDTADHENEWALDGLPSSQEALSFSATVHVGWRVTDPAEIVRRQVRNGAAYVRARVFEELRTVCRQFSPTDCAMAEHAAEAAFADSQPYEAGITVYRLAVHLVLDPLAREHLRQRYDVGRQLATEEAHHELQRLKQEYNSELESARLSKIQVSDFRSLVQLHLARNPQDTEMLLKLTAEYETETRESTRHLFEAMLTNGLVQSADVENLVGLSAGLLGSTADPQLPPTAPQAVHGPPTWSLYLIVDPSTGRNEELAAQVNALLEVRDAHPELVRATGVGVVTAGSVPVLLRSPFDTGSTVPVPDLEDEADIEGAMGVVMKRLTAAGTETPGPTLRPWMLLIGQSALPPALPAEVEGFAVPDLTPEVSDVLVRALLDAAAGRRPDPAGLRSKPAV